MTNDETAMTELRELVARTICRANCPYGTTEDAIECQTEHAWDLWLREADAVLALPRIKAGLEALERDEAMGRKLGHTISVGVNTK